MTVNRAPGSDKFPAASTGSWVFGLAGAAFLLALIVASLSMPSESNALRIPTIAPETARGQAIFRGEGCLSCHPRVLSPRPLAPAGLGDELEGSNRLGPDLMNVTKKYPEGLLETRLTDPGALQPMTVMPSYANLSSDDLQALIAFLGQPEVGPGRWAQVRSVNRIEAVVPDYIIESLQQYVNPGTGVLTPPTQDTPEFRVVAQGIYNSRCAACHGLHGRGDGPASWKTWTGDGNSRWSGLPVSPAPPSDFSSNDFSGYSEVMWYWRISDGIPGAQMPAWKGVLSEDALWFLVGYMKQLSGAQENQIVGEAIQGSIVRPEGPFGPETWGEAGKSTVAPDIWGPEPFTPSTPGQNEIPIGGAPEGLQP